MDARQYRDYVVFRFHCEYIEKRAVVRATDGDVHIGILFCFLPLLGIFRNLLNYLEMSTCCRHVVVKVLSFPLLSGV